MAPNVKKNKMTLKNDMTEKIILKMPLYHKMLKNPQNYQKMLCFDIIKNCLKTTYHDIPKNVLDIIKNTV